MVTPPVIDYPGHIMSDDEYEIRITAVCYFDVEKSRVYMERDEAKGSSALLRSQRLAVY